MYHFQSQIFDARPLDGHARPPFAQLPNFTRWSHDHNRRSLWKAGHTVFAGRDVTKLATNWVIWSIWLRLWLLCFKYQLKIHCITPNSSTLNTFAPWVSGSWISCQTKPGLQLTSVQLQHPRLGLAKDSRATNFQLELFVLVGIRKVSCTQLWIYI